MRVEDVMTREVKSCRPDDSLERAAQLMWECDCGSVPVCASDGITRAVGMITDRDVCMCAYITGKPLRELKISDAISGQQLLACKPTDSISDAENAMRRARVRRLPVVDAQGSLVGLLSLADIAREAARQHELADKQITDAEVNATLVAICAAPRTTLHA